MTAPVSLREQWRTRIEQPLDYVSADCLAACFAQALSREQLDALLAHARFRPRLQDLLMEHFSLWPLTQPPVEADIPVLLTPPEQFARLALLCGATWHANTLAREIRGKVVQTLKQRLGADVFDFALAHRAHAGAVDLLLDVEQLLRAIERDGQACVAAWFHAQPTDLQAWLRLRLDAQWLAPAEGGVQGIDLLRSVAQEAAA